MEESLAYTWLVTHRMAIASSANMCFSMEVSLERTLKRWLSTAILVVLTWHWSWSALAVTEGE